MQTECACGRKKDSAVPDGTAPIWTTEVRAQGAGLFSGRNQVVINVRRLRKEFRKALFATIEDSLVDPTEARIRAEVRALIEALFR